jgi:hypothetical protein
MAAHAFSQAKPGKKRVLLSRKVLLLNFNRSDAMAAEKTSDVLAVPFAPFCGMNQWPRKVTERAKVETADEPSAAGAAGTYFGVRGLVRAFGRRLVAVERGEGHSAASGAAARACAAVAASSPRRRGPCFGDESPKRQKRWQVTALQIVVVCARRCPLPTQSLLSIGVNLCPSV